MMLLILESINSKPPTEAIMTEISVSYGLINSLAPEKFEWTFMYVIFKWIVVIAGWGISCEIVLIWMSLDFTDDQSTWFR